MSATYNPALPTDLDWVRHLIRDTDIVSPLFQNEEIQAVLDLKVSQAITSPASRYFAAADLLSSLHTLWMARGRGVASKKVGKLAITYGTGIGINVDAALQLQIKDLRKQGAILLSPRPFSFACV
jgi:hypothetical protein